MFLKFLTIIPRGWFILNRIWNRVLRYTSRGLFAECGRNVAYYPINSTFTYSHIHIGNDIQIGEHACLVASVAHIYIGNKVRLGPSVTIRGGNHITDVVGKFMFDFSDKDKRPGDDEDVIIKDDVWVGTNVTILKGVTIGRGCVIAAGAVVNKSTPPYSIVGGVPAKVLKFRFTQEQIKEHERILYGNQSQ